jgi:hypothetical protein
MTNHWSEAFLLLETLTRKAQNIDKDGMELRFTRTTRHEKPSAGRELESFRNAMIDPEVRPREGRATDMCSKLAEIFTEWLKTAGTSNKGNSSQTILILTDGIWGGQRQEDAVDNKIIEFENKRKSSTNDVRPRALSLQFISFGTDAFALDRLQRLDNQWKERKIA